MSTDPLLQKLALEIRPENFPPNSQTKLKQATGQAYLQMKSLIRLQVLKTHAQHLLQDKKRFKNYVHHFMLRDSGAYFSRQKGVFFHPQLFEERFHQASDAQKQMLRKIAQRNAQFIDRMIKRKDKKSLQKPKYATKEKYYNRQYKEAHQWLQQYAPHVLPMPISKTDFGNDQRDQNYITTLKQNGVMPYVTEIKGGYYYVIFSASHPKNASHKVFSFLLKNDTNYFYSQLKPFEVNPAQPTYLGDNLQEIKAYAVHQVYEKSSDQEVLSGKVDAKVQTIENDIQVQINKVIVWLGNRINTEGAYLADYLFGSAFDEARNFHKGYPGNVSGTPRFMFDKNFLKHVQTQGFKAYAKAELARITHMLETGVRPMTMAERANTALKFERLMKIIRASWKKTPKHLVKVPSKSLNNLQIQHMAKVSEQVQALSRQVQGYTTVKITPGEIKTMKDRLSLLKHELTTTQVSQNLQSLKLMGKLGKVANALGQFLDYWGLAYNAKRMKGDKFDELAWPGVGSILPLLKDMSGVGEKKQDEVLVLVNKINRNIENKNIGGAQYKYRQLKDLINQYNRRQGKIKDGTPFGLIYSSNLLSHKQLDGPTGKVSHNLQDMKPGIVIYDLLDLIKFEKKMGVKLHQLHIGSLTNYDNKLKSFKTFATLNLPVIKKK